MSYQVKPGNIFGRIGTGIGQGLAEQVPKEVERYRLSKGLEDLAKKPLGTPFEQVAGLAKIPGISSELISTLAPLLQRQQAARELSQTQGQLLSPQAQTDQQLSGMISRAPEPLAPSQEEKRLSDPYYLTPAPIEKIQADAAQLMQQFPTLYGNDPEKALAEAQSRDSRRLAQDQAFEARQNLVKDRFSEILGEKLQKGGAESYSDVLGDLQRDFINKAISDVNAGRLNPLQAANKYGQEALDFAKSRQNLKALGAKSFFSRTPSGTRKALEAIRDQYGKLGQLESFSNDLQAYEGLSPYYSNYIAFPVKSNKAINNELASLKPKNTKDIREGKATTEESIANNVGKNLSDKDSLLAIGLALHGKGYDESKFMDQIRKDYEEGKIRLNQRQSRELEQREKVSPSIGDLYLFAFSGLDKLLEQQ